MTSSRRVLVGIAGVGMAFAMVVIGPGDTALGAPFPGFPGLGGGDGRPQPRNGQDGRDGADARGGSDVGEGRRGQQGEPGEEGGKGDQRRSDSENDKNDKNDDVKRDRLTPLQRAQLDARQDIARAREDAANARF